MAARASSSSVDVRLNMWWSIKESCVRLHTRVELWASQTKCEQSELPKIDLCQQQPPVSWRGALYRKAAGRCCKTEGVRTAISIVCHAMNSTAPEIRNRNCHFPHRLPRSALDSAAFLAPSAAA